MMDAMPVRAMGMAQWVEMPTGTHAVTTAAIALFVHMKPMLGTGLQAADLASTKTLAPAVVTA